MTAATLEELANQKEKAGQKTQQTDNKDGMEEEEDEDQEMGEEEPVEIDTALEDGDSKDVS